jgi:hypothetical protein
MTSATATSAALATRASRRRTSTNSPAPPKREHFALYNVIQDAAETRDRAAEQPEQVKKLRAAVQRLYSEINP